MKERMELPMHRAKLYEWAIDILMRQWAAHKRVHEEPTYEIEDNTSFGLAVEKLVISEVAAKFFEKGKIFFERHELERLVGVTQRSLVNFPQKVTPADLINDIAVRQGLLVARSHDVYSFSHLTVQEFFTSLHFSNSAHIREVILSQGKKARWREVFLLMAGLDQIDTALMLKSLVHNVQDSQWRELDILFEYFDDSANLLSTPDEMVSFERRLSFFYLILVYFQDQHLLSSIENIGGIAGINLKKLQVFTELCGKASSIECFESRWESVRDLMVFTTTAAEREKCYHEFAESGRFLSSLIFSYADERNLIDLFSFRKRLSTFFFSFELLFDCRANMTVLKEETLRDAMSNLLRPRRSR